MILRAQCCYSHSTPLRTQTQPLCRKAWGSLAPRNHSRLRQGRTRDRRGPPIAQLLTVVMASAQMRNPHYSLTVAEVLDSPLGYLALMAVPVGLYFMFKILLWDYTSRRTDNPKDADRSQSFSLTARPGPGQMCQADLPPPIKHVVKDPALQAMAADAASTVAEAVRHAKAHYEGELKLRRLNNDHVGAMEWDWVWSLLQGKQGSTTGVLQEEVVEKAQQQVAQGQPASSGSAVSVMLAEVVAEQQALRQVELMCKTLADS
ncbi:hypothetical protein ABBQ32_004724 [Trebouxia sp. C0010 RCD-2024]